ncbi:hypothetical protein [Thiorhodococcus minor]|uniref:Uncharacterized protein n=1 Tax=Thiorhodococcus minor TaxID=57489 RepID=A0A6M0K4W9_9GAMM|nr:hypothetical protein [Thiorhodococcus minor]NEV64331.1 hypothetical protein [Thiorhodococcus minor]
MTDTTSLAADSIVYHVPLERLSAYRGRHLIVRSDNPHALVDRIGAVDLDDLAYVQLCSLPSGSEALIHWAEGLGVELVLESPADDFARLYEYAKLLDNHPVRVLLPVEPGFEKAAKLAASLQFAVRLQVGQPAVPLIESLAQVLDDYLHRPTVGQPIDYFHSVLLGLCHRQPISLWAIQEEDPALVRHVDAGGKERLPGKLAGADVGVRPGAFVEQWARRLRTEGAECAECPFFAPCRGYFKWPRRDYDCAGVKTLFRTLQQAADALRADIAAIPPAGDASAP